MRDIMAKTLYMGSDHAGLELKNLLLPALREQGWIVEDMGAYDKSGCDYPEYAHAVCAKVLEHDSFGILVCGTGLGMSMAANRHKGIRAAVCSMEFHARAAREHNNANILCLGERVTGPGLALQIAEVFLGTGFTGGRHQQRIEKIEI